MQPKLKPGNRMKIHKKDKSVDTWLLIGIRFMSSSGQRYLRVRHNTGFSGHIMIQDIDKIEVL